MHVCKFLPGRIQSARHWGGRLRFRRVKARRCAHVSATTWHGTYASHNTHTHTNILTPALWSMPCVYVVCKYICCLFASITLKLMAISNWPQQNQNCDVVFFFSPLLLFFSHAVFVLLLLRAPYLSSSRCLRYFLFTRLREPYNVRLHTEHI